MSKNPYTINLPDSILVNELSRKFEEKSNNGIEFDYIGILNDLRNTVSEQVSYINMLFPEYTPHDEKYHINNLFRIADTILGDELIKNMNLNELFLLACSLYGHDWGMAVSETHRACILNKVKDKNVLDSNNLILNKDVDRFKKFINENKLVLSSEVPIEIWREYIRKNHHLRSGELIKQFLLDKNSGVAEATKRICEGHGLSFSEIRDLSTYSPNFAILGESVNLRALTVYVRLIDLLDITQDRTPYAIWKFINPKDPFSKMEWEKHRALYSVTSIKYQKIRAIKIDGKTNDHRVYAALKDLESWVNEQFKGCNDLLFEINDKYHKLDLSHIEWNIEADGFVPINIRFEFDRMRMLEILGEQIYNNDPYVFLRELLQNSIDAIKTRAELLKIKGINFNDFGKIEVKIEKHDDSSMLVSIKDNGIGMNEYIIKNYLALAGRSYYRSDDFKKLGINIDPISRFGIGMLSCNAVSDHIQIETWRDPYLENGSKKLRIDISSFNSYFRVEEVPDVIDDIGTTVRVFIDDKKVEKCGYNINDYNIVEYLSYVAAFVDIPILINDGIKKYVILHPNKDYLRASEKYESDVEIKQLDFGFLWDQNIKSTDVEYGKSLLENRISHIGTELKMEGYEGFVAFISPKQENYDFIRDFDEYSLVSDNHINEVRKIKVTRNPRLIKEYTVDICPSCKINKMHTIYRNGILVPDGDNNLYFYEQSLFTPRVVVNLIGSDKEELDISRRKSIRSTSLIYKIIRLWHKKMINDAINISKDYTPHKKLLLIGKLIGFYEINPEYIPTDFYFALFMDNYGKVCIKQFDEYKNSTVYSINLSKEDTVMNKFLCRIRDEKECVSYDSNGLNAPIVFTGIQSLRCSLSVLGIETLSNYILKKHYFCNSMTLLSSDIVPKSMIEEYTWLPIVDSMQETENKTILSKACDNFQGLSLSEKKQVFEILNDYTYNDYVIISKIPNFIEFLSPLDKYFMFYRNADLKMNLLHPLSQQYLKLLCKLTLYKIDKKLPKGLHKKIDEAFEDFNWYEGGEILASEIIKISELLFEYKIIDQKISCSLLENLEILYCNS